MTDTILVKKTRAEPGEASLEVTIPPDNVKAAEERATKVYQQRARLPGFRQGKAPAAVVRKKFADDIRQETLRELVQESWRAAQHYQFVLGEGRAIHDVEERIMNLAPRESVDATVRFPDDFAEEAKREQTRDIHLTLREIKRQELAALDDAFAREMGDFESLDALRTAVTTDLGKEAEREADAKVRGELIEQIVQANNVIAPRPLVERVLAMYAQAYEVPEERWEKFAQEFRAVAESQVRRDLVLDTVVESQNLRATEAELDQRLQELAERRGMQAAELYASLEKAKRLRDVARSITEEKVFAYLLSQSTVEQALRRAKATSIRP